MQRSESIAKVAEALAAAQGEFPEIPKDRTVTVRSRRTETTYSFSYAPLDTILRCVRPALAKHGLALAQSVVVDEKGAELLRTSLLHSSGEWLANELPLFTGAGDNASQSYGQGLTYARRYGVTALLCIAAEEDDDGNGEDDDFERVPRQRGAGSKPAPSRPPKDAKQDGDPGIYLSESQKRLLLAKAKAAGLEHEEGTDAALVQRYNRIDTRNINQILADLSAMRDQQQAEVPA
jgi:hypothetical protein